MRVKTGVVTSRRHKKILAMAKGYRGRSKNCFRIAIRRVQKAMQYAYRDRKVRKRDFRGLWIQRINAAVRMQGMTYSQFMGLATKMQLGVDRKMLADLAMNSPEAFQAIVEKVKKSA